MKTVYKGIHNAGWLAVSFKILFHLIKSDKY
jgi:hypothetical protein